MANKRAGTGSVPVWDQEAKEKEVEFVKGENQPGDDLAIGGTSTAARAGCDQHNRPNFKVPLGREIFRR
jgi:hypothetical protein